MWPLHAQNNPQIYSQITALLGHIKNLLLQGCIIQHKDEKGYSEQHDKPYKTASFVRWMLRCLLVDLVMHRLKSIDSKALSACISMKSVQRLKVLLIFGFYYSVVMHKFSLVSLINTKVFQALQLKILDIKVTTNTCKCIKIYH